MVNQTRSTRRRARALPIAVVVAIVALAIAPSAQAACSSPLSQTFLKWNDSSYYTLATGGNMESSLGLTLSGGASIVSGNESYYVGGTTNTHSLKLASGSSATLPYMCVDSTYPNFRLFVRNTGSSASRLKVEVLYKTSTGVVKALTAGNLSTANTSWQLSAKLGIASGQVQLAADGTGRVAFRLTPADSVGNWQVDDLYVDPHRR
jgi:hypothetical protein